MFFYEPLTATAWVSVLLYLAFLIGMNELSRLNKWVGGAIFIALPLILTIFVWPHTAVEGTGAGTWFQWVKTYSCLAGAILGWLIVYFPAFQKKYIVCIPPIIFAINILEACIRDFQLTGVNGIVDGYMVVGGPWNVINGIAGILNALCICGFFGIIVSRGKKKDFVWPNQLWFWIIGYDLWNFAYTYNSVSDRSMYCGLVLLAACTIPAFFIKRGAYAQHRVRTLAVNMIVTMTIPWFYLHPAFVVHSTNAPAAHMTISVIALLFNIGVFVYQAYTIIKKKRNPFKQEASTSTTPDSARSTLKTSTFPKISAKRRWPIWKSSATRPHGTRRAASTPWSRARSAQTLGLYAMFAMAVPQFYTFAEIPTTHNPAAFFVVSLVALASNVALAAYQLHRIRIQRLNPLKDELYTDSKSYREVVEENR